jgi:4-hydroxybenzoate polyprenyltransferase
MARTERLKEEIGWLKVPFGVLVVVDASLLGWLAQTHADANPALVLAAGIASIAVTSGLFWINRIAYLRIDDLEET